MSHIRRTLTITVEERDDGKLLLSTKGADGDYERREISYRSLSYVLTVLDHAVQPLGRFNHDYSILRWLRSLGKDPLACKHCGSRHKRVPEDLCDDGRAEYVEAGRLATELGLIDEQIEAGA